MTYLRLRGVVVCGGCVWSCVVVCGCGRGVWGRVLRCLWLCTRLSSPSGDDTQEASRRRRDQGSSPRAHARHVAARAQQRLRDGAERGERVHELDDAQQPQQPQHRDGREIDHVAEVREPDDHKVEPVPRRSEEAARRRAKRAELDHDLEREDREDRVRRVHERGARLTSRARARRNERRARAEATDAAVVLDEREDVRFEHLADRTARAATCRFSQFCF